MKNMKRWIAICIAVVLLIGVAFDRGNPLFADLEEEVAQGTEAVQNVDVAQEEPVAEEVPVEPAEEVQPEQEAEAEPTPEQQETVTPTPSADAIQEEIAAAADPVQFVSTVNGTKVIVTAASEEVLPANAELVVKTISNREMKDIVEAVEEKAEEEAFAIKGIEAYDITFYVDGQEIQPTAPVQVKVETPEIQQNDDAKVFHVDDNNNVENMATSVENNGDVIFEAPHFSTYVIVNANENKEIKVTVKHYDRSTNKEIYKEDDITLPVGEQLVNYNKAQNWEVQEVKVEEQYAGAQPKTLNATDAESIDLHGDATVSVYYKAKTGQSQGTPSIYDYETSINYQDGAFVDGKKSNDRILMGNHPNDTFRLNNKQVNYWLGSGVNKPEEMVKGLLYGIDPITNKPIFNYAQPGFFEDSDLKNGNNAYHRRYYDNFTLTFDQTGDSYKLKQISSPNFGTRNAGADFFALGNGNFYFGMRYDVEFTIGDYIGPMTYKFTGDDDMWVVLDNDKVIIDLGGIHDASTDSVDLWSVLLEEAGMTTKAAYANLSEAKKEELRKQYVSDSEKANKKHKLTVLYMERGAGYINCYMEYVLPNAQIATPSTVPVASVSLLKVDSQSNNPLSGAEFTLTNKNDSTTRKVTSGADGRADFNNLRKGDYVLEETKAPDGYIGQGQKWNVVVTESGTNATARLYAQKEGGSNGDLINPENGVYKVTNTSESNWLKSNMSYDKEAKVVDWDKREYQININASAIPTTITTTTEATPADIVLVLDRSGSMSGNKMTSLKSAAKAFVDGVATKSPKTKIAVVSYGSDVKTNINLTEAGTGKQSIKSAIDGLNVYGATQIDYGLYYARDVLKNSTRPKYVVLFTDGVPTSSNTWDDNVASSAQTQANYLKNSKATIYTVGLGLGDRAKIWLRGGRYGTYSYSGIASSAAHAFETADASGILNIFNAISTSITQNESVSGVTIKDVVDKRFELVNDDEKVVADGEYYLLSNGKFVAKSTASNQQKKDGVLCVVSTKDGRRVITWSDQTVTKDGWSKSILVKAKDDYIGGNAVTTNYNDKLHPENGSSISYDGKKDQLPQPDVNVKAVLEVDDKEIDIYKGDSIPTDDELLNLYDIDQYLNKYEKVTDKEFTVTWSEDPSFTTGMTREDLIKKLESVKTAEDTIEKYQYYVKVQYNAGKTTDTSNANTTKNGTTYISGGDDRIEEAVNKNNSSNYGTYTINEKSGTITVTKRIKIAPEAKKFKFNIIAPDGSTKTLEVTVESGADSGMASIDKLARGVYRVFEDETELVDYSMEAVTIDDATDTQHEATTDTSTEAIFTFGNDVTTKENVIANHKYIGNGVLGGAIFQNEDSITSWGVVKVSKKAHTIKLQNAEFKLTTGSLPDGKYYGKSDEKGIVTWYSDNNYKTEVDKLDKGEYTLVETKAPAGYSVSSVEWDIKIGRNGKLLSIASKSKDNQIAVETVTDKKLYVFEDEALYELPKSGGSGIYWYTISGMLLMIASALILYKKRGEEVLKK